MNGRYVTVACPDCGAPRGVDRWRPAARCRSCNGKRTQASAAAGNTGRLRPLQSARQRGSGNPAWRGGRVKDARGYWRVRVDDGDVIGGAMKQANGYVMEHRLLMARAIGRSLEPWEQVHHRNGQRDDNQLDNLELWKLSQPSGVRSADYHCPGCTCDKEEEQR